MNNKIVGIVGIIIIILGIGFLIYNQPLKNRENLAPKEKTNFDLITNKDESIFISNPKRKQTIKSPIELKGKVSGNWLFEGKAPVILTDWDGKIIGESQIQVDGNWMTDEMQQFEGELTFEEPEDIGDFSRKGKIIFQKANPSALPQNSDAVEFTVFFR